MNNQVLTYLKNHNVVTLATNGAQGVWATAVFYVTEGYTLYFLSAPHTRHSKNIAQQPQVAATIQENYATWEEIKGIQLEGKCVEVAAEHRQKVIDLYAQKFPIIGKDAPPQITKALDKINWYQLIPERLFYIDNSKGLGHRVEVEIGN